MMIKYVRRSTILVRPVVFQLKSLDGVQALPHLIELYTQRNNLVSIVLLTLLVAMDMLGAGNTFNDLQCFSPAAKLDCSWCHFD